jgi:hypothetical protein
MQGKRARVCRLPTEPPLQHQSAGFCGLGAAGVLGDEGDWACKDFL